MRRAGLEPAIPSRRPIGSRLRLPVSPPPRAAGGGATNSPSRKFSVVLACYGDGTPVKKCMARLTPDLLRAQGLRRCCRRANPASTPKGVAASTAREVLSGDQDGRRRSPGSCLPAFQAARRLSTCLALRIASRGLESRAERSVALPADGDDDALPARGVNHAANRGTTNASTPENPHQYRASEFR